MTHHDDEPVRRPIRRHPWSPDSHALSCTDCGLPRPHPCHALPPVEPDRRFKD